MTFAQSDRAWLKSMQAGWLSGLAPTFVTSPVGAVADQNSRPFPWALWNAGPATAATALAETPMGTVPRQGKVRSVTLGPAAATAADGGSGNYATITVYWRNNAGGAQTAIASWSTQTSAQGALALNTPATMLLAAAANLQVPNGALLTVAITKTGTGAAIGQGMTVTVDIEEN